VYDDFKVQAISNEIDGTKQVAPTVLEALRIPPWPLDAVRAEHTEPLPSVRF